MAGLEPASRVLPTHVRAGDLSEPEQLQALPGPSRRLMHPLRLLTYRAHTGMAVRLAPQPNNSETAHSLVRALFGRETSLLPAANTLTAHPLREASLGQDAALAVLLAASSWTRAVFAGTDLSLVSELPPSDRCAVSPKRGVNAISRHPQQDDATKSPPQTCLKEVIRRFPKGRTSRPQRSRSYPECLPDVDPPHLERALALGR